MLIYLADIVTHLSCPLEVQQNYKDDWLGGLSGKMCSGNGFTFYMMLTTQNEIDLGPWLLQTDARQQNKKKKKSTDN